MDAAALITLELAAGTTLVAVVVWLIRLEAVAKRAKEQGDKACSAAEKLGEQHAATKASVERAQEKAQEACLKAEKLEEEVDALREALRPIERAVDVLVERVGTLIRHVQEGNTSTDRRLTTLESKIDHALNNARQAHEAASELKRRARREAP